MRRLLGTLALALIGAAGCRDRNGDEERTTKQASLLVATEHCKHQRRCADAGATEQLVRTIGKDLCVEEERKRLRDDLDDACPAGVDPRAVQACVEVIRKDACREAVEVVPPAPECLLAELCAR